MAESNLCDICCFRGSLSEDCEFEFWRRWRSSKWIPRDCPRGIPRNANWKKYEWPKPPKPLSDYELQVWGVFINYPSNFGLKRHNVINLLNGRRAGRRNSRFTNINTLKRAANALQTLQRRGKLHTIGRRWFLSDARGVGESNRGVRA